MLRIFRNFFRLYLRPIYLVIQATINSYGQDRVQRMGAALAYYTIFSLPAILIIIIGLVGFFLGEAAVEGRIYDTIVEFVGEAAAEQIQNAVKNIGSPSTNWLATILGLGFLIFLSTHIFYALQEALNTIFGVREVARKMQIVQMIINRILSFGMILSIGGLLVLSILLNGLILGLSTYIKGHQDWVASHLPDQLAPAVSYFTSNFLVFLNLGVSILIIAIFFMLMYKILPAARLRWRYIWWGSIFSAILFWLGQLLMGYYLSHTSIVSAYGATGSLIIILLWVYYSAQLIFIGAEFIKAICEYRGVIIQPKAFAKKMQKERQWVKKSRRKDDKGRVIELYESPLPNELS